MTSCSQDSFIPKVPLGDSEPSKSEMRTKAVGASQKHPCLIKIEWSLGASTPLAEVL